MKTQKVVILGAGYAGVNAALRLRTRNKAAEITVVNERPEFVERIRNHQRAAGQRIKQLAIKDVLGKKIQFVCARAERIDHGGKQVLLRDDGGVAALEYDILVYALGSGAARGDGQNTFSVNTAAAADILRRELERDSQKPVVIIGAGLTGLELATELREKWPERQISLVDRHALGHTLAAKGREYLTATLAAMRINFRLAAENPTTTDAIVVDCTGFHFPDLARTSGLKCDERNRVLTNEHLQAIGHDDIFVCGDAASHGFGSEAIPYAGCATAMPMGTHVGEAIAAFIAGKNLKPFRFGFMGRCISLGRKRGLVQMLDKYSGAAVPRALTGKTAAIVKELICKMTLSAPKWERKTGWPIYTWSKARLMKKIGAMTSKAA